MIVPNLKVLDTVVDDIAVTIENGIRTFDETIIGPDSSKPLWAVYYNDSGDLVGGLRGYTIGIWFHIISLWVRHDCRSRGIGSRILGAAEYQARIRGCRKFHTTTTSYQAPEFYKKLGYKEDLRLEELPPGYALIFFTKSIET